MNWYRIKIAQFQPLKDIFDIGHHSYNKGWQDDYGCTEYIWVWSQGKGLLVTELTEDNPGATHSNEYGYDYNFRGRAEKCNGQAKVSIVPKSWNEINAKVPSIMERQLERKFGPDVEMFLSGMQ
tara:strand:- start:528 stop:899 length:372 start_codon:yes stop_codon:yes gene_type:complete